jgi:hypothetical protein
MRYPALWLFCGLLSGLTAHAAEWRALWNQRDLSGWDTFLAKPDRSWDVPGVARDATGNYLEPIGLNRDPLGVFSVTQIDGRPALHISGQGFGVLTTRDVFQNYHLKLQIKWGERKWGSRSAAVRDSGLLYHVHGDAGFDHGTWPRSIEFQIQEHDMGDLYALGTQITVKARAEEKRWLYDPKGTDTLFVQMPPVGNRCIKLRDREKPYGEWNTLELIVLGSDSVHIVNGEVVMRLHHAQRLDGAAPEPLNEGAISLQTEGAEVYYRDIEIQPITAIPEEWAEKP